MSEQQNGFSRMNNVNHSGGTNRPSSGPARSEGSASRRFSNIPLARKIEALILTAVTIIASMSVDWSSLMVRAEEPAYRNTLTSTGNSIDVSTKDPVLTLEIIGDGGNDGTNTQYQTINQAYMYLRVTGSAYYTVDVYQNYTADQDYTDGVRNGGNTDPDYHIGASALTTSDANEFETVKLWNINRISPINLNQGERATIAVTFSKIASGTTIEYGTDPANNNAPIEVETKYASTTADNFEIVSQRNSYVTYVGAGDIDFSNDFSLSPAYDRTMSFKLFNGKVDDLTDSSDLKDGTDVASINQSNKTLTPLATGENTLVVSAGNSFDGRKKIPVRVVNPGISTTTVTYGSTLSEPAPTCGADALQSGQFTALISGTADNGQKYTNANVSDVIYAGTYTMTLTGLGDYDGLSYSQKVKISPKSLEQVTITSPSTIVVNPESLTVADASGALTDNGTSLVLGQDFTVESVSQTATPGTYEVALSGLYNYTGEVKVSTTQTTGGLVNLANMVKGLKITPDSTDKTNFAIYTFDGNAHNTPGITFYGADGNEIHLTQGTDYEYSIINQGTNVTVYDSENPTSLAGAIDAGDYTVAIRGRGSLNADGTYSGYAGTIYSTSFTDQIFKINPAQLSVSNVIVTVSPTKFVYTGDKRKPTNVTVEFPYTKTDGTSASWSMREGIDFTATFPDDAIEPGSYAVILHGKGNFTGDVDFNHCQQATSPEDLAAHPNKIHYSSVAYYDIISSLSKATIELGKANSLTTGDATNADKKWVSDYSEEYDGTGHRPTVKVMVGGDTLIQYAKNADGTYNNATAQYQVIYNDAKATAVGNATLTIRGMGAYAGQDDITVTYSITAKSLTANALQIDDKVEKTYIVGGLAQTLTSNDKYYVYDSDGKTALSGATLKDGEETKTAEEIAKLYPKADYYLTYENNQNAGTATVTAHGINNYTGESQDTFEINKLKLSGDAGFTVEAIPDQSYTGSQVKPDEKDQIIVKYKGYYTLVNGTDYHVTYKDNIKKGEATVLIDGINNYEGELTANFTIVAKSLVDGSVKYQIGSMTKEQALPLYESTGTTYKVEYTGKVAQPKITLTNGSYTLQQGADKDYMIDWGTAPAAAAVGEQTITIIGQGNYAGHTAYLTYKVTKKDFSNESFVLTPVKPADVDTGTCIVTGTDSIKRYYQVTFKKDNTVLKPAKATDGTDQSADCDYSFRWTDLDGNLMTGGRVPSIAGSGYTLLIMGRRNYQGTKTITLDSAGNKLMVGASLSVANSIGVVGYSGNSTDSGVDFQIPYLGDNLPQVYPATSFIKGADINKTVDGTIDALSGPTYENGKYKNESTADYSVYFVPSTTTDDAYTSATRLTTLNAGDTFRIVIEATKNSKNYFGSHISGIFKLAPRKLSDFSDKTAKGTLTVTDTANTSAGTYKLIDGNVEKDASGNEINSKLSYEYTGGTITPNLKVVFKPTSQKSDVFTGSFVAIDLSAYSQSIDPKTITADSIKTSEIKVSADKVGSDGSQCFSGSLSVPYAITAKQITADMVSLQSPTSVTYDGQSHKKDIVPVVKIGSNTLEKGVDYSVEYYLDESCSTKIPADSDSAFTNAGTIYVKIYKGSDSKYSVPDDGIKISTPFVITGEDISGATIELETKTKTPYYAEIYNGSEVKPTVKVTLGGTPLTEKTDFKVDYANNTEIGVATVTITGKGNYTGTATQQFYIYGSLKEATATGIKNNETYVIKSKGKPEDSKGNVIDYTDVSFKVGSKTLEKDTNYSVTVTHDDGTVAKYGLAEPGKYIITYTGLGIDHYCDSDTSESVTYSVTIRGDIKNYATVSGYSSIYDYAGTKPYGPQNSKDIKIKLTGGYRVPTDAYTITPNANERNKPSSEKNMQPHFTIKIADSYKYYYIADTGDTLDVSFAIKYNLQKATIKLKAGEEAPVYGEGEDDVDELKEKIEVTYPGITGTLPTEAYQVTGAVWKSVGSSNKAQLQITIGPDEGEVLSYNAQHTTIGGSWKQFGDIMVSGETSKEYANTDYYSDFKGCITVNAADGTPLSEGADYTVQFRKADSNGKYSATGTVDSQVRKAGKYYAEIKGLGAYHTDKPIVLKDAGQVFIVNPKNISTSTMDLVDKNVKYYSGADPEAQYTVTDTELNAVLKENTDYTIAHTETAPAGGNLWDVGTVITYTVTGTGNYIGTNTATVTIEAADLNANGVIDVQNDSIEYDGQPHGLEFKVYRGKTPLTEGVDYYIDSKNTSVNVGKYTYTITGKDHYTGSKTIDFSITPRDLSKATIKLTKKEYDWSGTPITPTDYTISDSAVTNSTILKDVAVSYVNNTNSYKYVDDNETDASAPAVVFTASGNYTGTVTKHFQIGSDIKDATVTLDDDSEPYSPTTPFRPNVKSITFNGTTYDANSTPALSGVATWSYATADGTPISSTSEPKNAGNYKVVVTGQGGPFFGSTDAEYTITSNPVSIADLDVQIKRDTNKAHGQHYDSASGDYYYYYTGEDIEPEVEVTYTSPDTGKAYTLTASSSEDDTSGDYYLTYDNNDQVGTATVIAHLHNNYESDSDLEGEAYFYIYARDISDYKVSVKGGKVRYTGYELEPDYIVTTDDRTYDSSVAADKAALDALGIEAKYTNNIAPGTGNIALTGSGNSTGTTKATATFIIYADLSSDVDYITPEEVFRTGKKLDPDITLHFVDKVDGTDHQIVESESKWFTSKCTLPQGKTWENADYINVSISHKADYLVRSRTDTIKLSKVPTDLTIEGYYPTYQYTGAKVTPDLSKLTVKSGGQDLPSGATVSYSFSGSKDGTACIVPDQDVTITAKVTYGGQTVSTSHNKYSTKEKEKFATFRIVPRPIKSCTFQGPSDARYTGSAVTPIFSINTGYTQLRNGADYTYTVRNNVKPGNAIVTIKGDGKYYIGTTTKVFHIYVAPVSGLTSSGRSGTTAVIRWNRSGTADGYRVTYTSTRGVRKMLITSGSANNYKLTDLGAGSTQVLVEAYVAGSSGQPIAYSAPESIYVR